MITYRVILLTVAKRAATFNRFPSRNAGTNATVKRSSNTLCLPVVDCVAVPRVLSVQY